MRLSRRTDYALRVLMLLAAEAPRPMDAPELAARYGVSLHHIRKVVQHLSQLGLVETRRGRDGGVWLAKDPRDINIGAVVRQTEDLALLECFDADRDTCRLTPACRLKGALKVAQDAFLSELDALTLAQVSPRSATTAKLLGRDGQPSGSPKPAQSQAQE